MTLNSRNVTLAEIIKIYGAHQKNVKEDRLIPSVAKYKLMIIVSRNIKYIVGVPWGEDVKYNTCYHMASSVQPALDV